MGAAKETLEPGKGVCLKSSGCEASRHPKPPTIPAAFLYRGIQSAVCTTGGPEGDLDRVFSIQHERVVNKDNTVRWDNLLLQIEPTRLRSTMADLDVIVYQN